MLGAVTLRVQAGVGTWTCLQRVMAVPRVMRGAHVGAGHTGHAATNDAAAAPIGTVHVADVFLKCGLMFELVNDGVQTLCSLFIICLIVAHHCSLGSAGIHCCCSHKTYIIFTIY